MQEDLRRTATRFIGERVLRREDTRLLTGLGRFVDDIALPGMLHAGFVRSPHARARIGAIDLSAASKLDVVRAVFTGDDVPPLVRDEARFVGDPIVLVLAESRAAAEDGCELVSIEFEPLPPVTDPRRAVEDSTNLVHAGRGSNIAARKVLPSDAVMDELFSTAAHVVEESIFQHRYVAAPMETRGIVARWEPALNAMTIWLSGQGAHTARDQFAQILGLPPTTVRVVIGDVGGAFGQKIAVGREELAVALAARLAARPVKWIEDRWENLVAAPHARRDEAVVRLAFASDGDLLAVEVDHLEDVGAHGSGLGARVLTMFPGPYRVTRTGGSSVSAFTNTASRGAYRGPWMFETIARETMIDISARKLGMDPLELRRRNVIRAGDLPYTAADGTVLDRITPAETLEQAASMIGYDDFRVEQAAARCEGRYLGIGIALCVEPTAIPFGLGATDAVTIRIDPSGAVQLLTGVNSQGHSIETTMAQVAADALGVDVDDIVVTHGDTGVSPVGGRTGGSRNAIFGGGAARQAALEMRERVLRIAAHVMEAAVDDLDIEDGLVSVRGTPAVSMTVSEVAALAYLRPDELPLDVTPGLEVASRFATSGPTYSNAAHICTCEVDVHTGLVRLLRYVVSEDCGVVINPMVVEGQIAGGVAQGVGGALFEHLVYDGDGNPLTTSFLDYLLPTASDIPVLEYGHITTPSTQPGGFKGMGEGGAIAAPAAVCNAVADALGPFGVTSVSQPITPDRILAAISRES